MLPASAPAARGRLGLLPAILGAVAALVGQSAVAQLELRHAQVNAAQGIVSAAAAASTATPNPDCTLIVPANPLTAAGLATPYQLVATDAGQGECHEYNTAQSAFVQAAIFDPATGSISIYNPLVIDAGTKPAVAPVAPTLPANAVVALWFGYNGTNLTLTALSSNTLSGAHCVNGLPGSVFGQYAYCNAPAFFSAANAAATSGKLKVPALARAKDGQTCPTVRNFYVVDQDQSDNVTTLYLVTTTGRIAQYNQKNLAALKGATVLSNPSDNRLTTAFVDPAIGCTPFLAPDLTDPGHTISSMALDELQAHLEQTTPVARVPGGDPMVQVSGIESLMKDNLYRSGVDMPQASSYHLVDTARYCRQMLRIAPGRMQTDKAMLSAFKSPDTGAANSLFTFMAQRFTASWEILNCKTLIGFDAPITVTTNADGVATSATINTTKLNADIKAIAGQLSSDNQLDSN